ncbi:peptidoglycan-binding protein [Lewinella sp. W8]|uniref:peptidoglycan-binding domain-containing protein n=1 Tax=Lewinella sp. W8 TaxID=2528208 RepID=UPI001067E6E9|nr:peptidoglycan-binding protein [Lewinella sp. W8]MTB52280.1 hypothetical protein [Lewinella sp. W8]
MRRLLFLLLCLSTFSFVSAQDLFTVQVGTFRDVKAADFAELTPLGFVYGAPRENQTVDVYLGNFSNQARAINVARDLINRGFRNAQALALPTAQGQEVTGIQIALIGNNQIVEWSKYEAVGPLFVEAVDGVTRVLTGLYPDSKSAADALPTIRSNGFQDAFIKRVNNIRLIPINTFETGIKKPLIPFELNDAPATTATPSPQPAVYGEVAAPTTYGGDLTARTPEPAANTASLSAIPAPAEAPGLPAIDGKTKRSSSAEVQRVLKERGYYEGSIDGYYGPGTTAAYRSAWEEMPEIRKYRLQTLSKNPAANQPEWPEIQVLMAVVDDLAAGMTNADRESQLSLQRNQIFNAQRALSPAASSRVRTWASTLWTNLDAWAAEDPLHAKIITAFRLSYHQSQVRLEDHYMDKGLPMIESRDLATAMLQSLVGGPLDRFL